MTSLPVVESDMLWFEHLSRSKAPALRLFCFPYAGGSAEIYRNWQQWFPQEIDLCLVHLPGRGKRMGEKAFTQAIPLVHAIADHISREINIPYALYGHSMGALISFELGWELFRRHGSGPQHLLVSGRSAPQWPRTQPRTFHLPYDEFLVELERLNGTPREVLANPELMKLFLGVLRADFETVETYEYLPKDRLAWPITVYAGMDDQHVSVESCQAWREQTTSACKIRMLPGDHFFIRNPRLEFASAFRSDVLSAAYAGHTRVL